MGTGCPDFQSRYDIAKSAQEFTFDSLLCIHNCYRFQLWSWRKEREHGSRSKFDELVKGTYSGVAIRSAGGLELAPSFKLLYATPSTYIWAVAADDAGNVFAHRFSGSRVSHHA